MTTIEAPKSKREMKKSRIDDLFYALRVKPDGKEIIVYDVTGRFSDISYQPRNLDKSSTYHIYVEILPAEIKISISKQLFTSTNIAFRRLSSIVTTDKKWWQFWKPVIWKPFIQHGDIFTHRKYQ